MAEAEQMKRTLAPSVTVWGWTDSVTEGGSLGSKKKKKSSYYTQKVNFTNTLYRNSLHSVWDLFQDCFGQVDVGLTLDIDCDWCLSSSGSSWIEDPAGVGASGVAVFGNNRKHTDSWLPLPVLHWRLQSRENKEQHETRNQLSVAQNKSLPHDTAGLIFFMCKALKLLFCSLARQVNHIFYDAARDIVLFPHFWECSPSALLVCHHLLNLFTAKKSILLSEERCGFSG